jgi:hypothetical protein
MVDLQVEHSAVAPDRDALDVRVALAAPVLSSVTSVFPSRAYTRPCGPTLNEVTTLLSIWVPELEPGANCVRVPPVVERA